MRSLGYLGIKKAKGGEGDTWVVGRKYVVLPLAQYRRWGMCIDGG